MGEVSETMTKKKKKGRPSLLDLQKRRLRQQQQLLLQNPNLSNSNSNPPTRRNPLLRLSQDGIVGDDDDDERKQKKHKLLVGLNSHHHYSTLSPSNSVPYGADGNEDAHDPEATTHKRRKINVARHGSDETNEKVAKATDSKHGSQGESGPTTPLPDKKLLVFILDRIQKKDTHEVFSEPVDPEELPDYHDIIEHPMDFGTVRKKLDGGLYTNLEQFENDVFLICSNAMQYNAQDTIYYRQARTMREMARKDFANLRQDSDDSEPQQQPQPQPKIVRRGRPPGKNSKKSLGTPPSERIGPESSSDATLASGGDNTSGPNNYNLRKGISKFQPADSLAKASPSNLNSGGYTNWLSEWETEFPASVLKAVLRYGKKQYMVDETRRDSYYNNPVASGNEPPVLATVDGEFKQLIAVGLNVKHSYARSLAHFAADLGPVVWKIAARKIRSVLPVGHAFGPGWVEDEMPQREQFSVYDEERSLDSSVQEDHSSRFSTPSGSFPVADKSCLQSGDMILNTRGLNSRSELNSLSNSIGNGIESIVPLRIQQEYMAHSDDLFGSNGRRLGPNISPEMRMVRLADLTGFPSSDGHKDLTNSSSNMSTPVKAQMSDDIGQSLEPGFEFQRGLAVKSSWQELANPVKHNSLSFGSDMNANIGATNSPTSSVDTGTKMRPNLALQL